MIQPDRVVVIDITRPYEILATCPECGTQRRLPENWRALVEPESPDWDGELRCTSHAMPVVMTLTPIRNPRIEADGSVVVHLVMDTDHRRALCTEQLWAGVPRDLPPGTLVRQCQACVTAARSR